MCIRDRATPLNRMFALKKTDHNITVLRKEVSYSLLKLKVVKHFLDTYIFNVFIFIFVYSKNLFCVLKFSYLQHEKYFQYYTQGTKFTTTLFL